jgi:hypothetical protein
MQDYTDPVIIVNSETGEVLKSYPNGVNVRSASERQNAIHHQKQEDNLFFEHLEKMKKQDERGPFVWNIHTIDRVYLPEVSASALNKLVYLSTYLSYDGFLIYDNHKVIERKDLGRLLWIESRQARTFWSEVTSAGILYEKDKKIYFNEDLFKRGEIKLNEIAELKEYDQRLVRFYVQGVRTLYESSCNTKNKNLSYIFRMLPFVNTRYNVVCYNPLETDPEKIETMQLGDFADIIGYGRCNSKQLSRAMFDPMFNFNGRDECAVRYVLCKDFSPEHYSIFVNPKVYYGGTNFSDVDALKIF